MGVTLSYADAVQQDQRAEANLAKSARGGSYLAAMALLATKIANSMSQGMLDKADQLDGIQGTKAFEISQDRTPGDLGENRLTTELQMETQRLNMFMTAITNAIKTFGEANAAMARKG